MSTMITGEQLLIRAQAAANPLSNSDLDITFWTICGVVWVAGAMVALIVLGVRRRRAVAEPLGSPVVVEVPTPRRPQTGEAQPARPAPVAQVSNLER